MITANVFAVRSIGKFSLGKTTNETKTEEFFAIKRSLKSFKKTKKVEFNTFVTKSVRNAIITEKIKLNKLIRGINPKHIIKDELVLESIPFEDTSFEQRNFLAKYLSKLDKTKRKILALKFGLIREDKQTNNKIAQRFGVTAERVRQIIKDTLNKEVSV